jgi:hypothetical protein
VAARSAFFETVARMSVQWGAPLGGCPSVTSSSAVVYAVTVPITHLGAKARFLGIDVGWHSQPSGVIC